MSEAEKIELDYLRTENRWLYMMLSDDGWANERIAERERQLTVKYPGLWLPLAGEVDLRDELADDERSLIVSDEGTSVYVMAYLDGIEATFELPKGYAICKLQGDGDV